MPLDESLAVGTLDITKRCADAARSLADIIGELTDDQNLGGDLASLAEDYTEQFRIKPPTLLRNNVKRLDSEPVTVDLTSKEDLEAGRPSHWVHSRKITLVVPFTGQLFLFTFRGRCADDFHRALPHNGNNTLELRYVRTDHDEAALRRDIEHDLDLLQTRSDEIASQCADYNRELPERESRILQERLERAEKDRRLGESLPFSLTVRPDSAIADVVPSTPRRLPVARPPGAKPRYLPDEEYDHILKLLGRMASVFERSPKAAQPLQEEEIRTLFLVILNSHYEGNATGETFNLGGRTDILLRVDNCNIFIGECKVWGGPSEVQPAVDQLMDYITVRDTKTALLFFVKNKSMDGIVDQVAEKIRGHGMYKETRSENAMELRCVFRHPRDEILTFDLAVQLYHIPPPLKTAGAVTRPASTGRRAQGPGNAAQDQDSESATAVEAIQHPPRTD
jgi:hypothetical protein